jgi:hypothetical protein
MLWLALWILLLDANGRNFPLPVPVNRITGEVPDSVDAREKTSRSRFSFQLDYSTSASCFFFTNREREEGFNHLDLIQNLKYHQQLPFDSICRITQDFVHNLGLRYYFDSIAVVQVDDNTLSFRIGVRFARRFSVVLLSDLSTRLFGQYESRYDTAGSCIRVRKESFLNPLVWTFSLGMGMEWKDFGSLDLGISSARLTLISDRSVFDRLGTDSYYGIPKGRSHCFEYGLSLRVIISRDVTRILHWDSDLRLFKEFRAPVGLAFENSFRIRIFRFLTAGIRTRLYYEEKVSKKVEMENILSVGFSFRL